MDRRRFHHLVRMLGSERSRRGLLGGVIAAVGFGLAADGTTAACKQPGAKCDHDTRCCDGTCVRTGRCRKNGRLTGKCRCGCTNHTQCDTHLCRDGACTQCTEHTDCPSQECGDGGVCAIPETCPANANACNEIVVCGTQNGAGCACFQRVEGGGSVCIGERSDPSNPCTSDDQCGLFGDGAVCVVDTPASGDGYCAGTSGLCGLPC